MTRLILNIDSCHFLARRDTAILPMLWIIILLLVLLLSWPLLSPLECSVDTRIPVIVIQWAGIGKATLVYDEEEWWLKLRVLFFYKKWSLMHLIFSDKKKKRKTKVKTVKRKKSTKRMPFSKIVNILKSFRLIQLDIAISNNDYIKNAWLYSSNFIPYIRRYVHVNFEEENYLTFVIRNNAWRIAYAFIK